MAEYLAGGVTLRELGLKYGYHFRKIHRWVKGVEKGRLPKEESIEGLGSGVSADEREMPSDIKELQRELREARLYNKLLNAMIDIAEEQMGASIRKKPGAKQ